MERPVSQHYCSLRVTQVVLASFCAAKDHKLSVMLGGSVELTRWKARAMLLAELVALFISGRESILLSLQLTCVCPLCSYPLAYGSSSKSARMG